MCPATMLELHSIYDKSITVSVFDEPHAICFSEYVKIWSVEIRQQVTLCTYSAVAANKIHEANLPLQRLHVFQ